MSSIEIDASSSGTTSWKIARLELSLERSIRFEGQKWMVLWHPKVIKKEVQSEKYANYFWDSNRRHWLNQVFCGELVENVI